MRRFNVTGPCVPREDYMVDISGKIEQIRKLVDDRSYFTINRARQYGKTTTLLCLKNALADDYLVASISFEGLSDKRFDSPTAFCRAFMRLIQRALAATDTPEEYRNAWLNENVDDFDELSVHITEMCKPDASGSDKKIVLMVDEVDKTSNNRVFIHFLGMLRDKFIARKSESDYTFHSVILAGVYDIKNIKLKMINEGAYTPAEGENKLYNSPWNIAVSFKVDMSFDPSEIATMLAEYEADHSTGMDIGEVAGEIYCFTSGYPFFVTRICQCIDEELGKDWTPHGVRDAVQIIIYESNTLFVDMSKNLESNKDLYDHLYNILFLGKEYLFNIDNPVVSFGAMYGYLKKSDSNKTAVANRIFEIRMHLYFLSKDETTDRPSTGVFREDVVHGGRLDMELCLRKFAEHYAESWSDRDADFIEREGRMLFLSYLKPLINGQGFYHIESQFADLRRMDIAVDFGREQFIVELKLWRGERGHEKAYDQLLGYMDGKGMKDGYMLTFDFRKAENKTARAQWLDFGGKRIFDVVV